MSPAIHALTLGAALGCGTAGGVFFGFSAFVMNGLARLPAPQGVAAMQSINVTAVRPAFMTALFGTAAACATLTVHSLRTWDQRHAPVLLAGSALYLLGAIGLTIARNVPLNNALAAIDPAGPDAGDHWTRYVAAWTRWNHVRAASALGAAGLFAAALAMDA